MHCININHPDFKSLQERLNIASTPLKGAIESWQNKNNTDRFPTDSYLKEYFKIEGTGKYKFSREEDFSTLHNLWEKSYREPIVFSEKELKEAEDSLLKAQGVFGINNVGLVPRVNGTFELRVLEPTLRENVSSIPNKSNVESIKDLLVRAGLAYKLHGEYYFIKGDHISKVLSKIKNFERENGLSKGTVSFLRKNNSFKVVIDDSLLEPTQYNITPQNSKVIIKYLSNYLTKKFFPISIKEVNVEQAEKVLGRKLKDNERSFILDGVVYAISSRITPDTLVEEFLHPFVNTLSASNIELLYNLYKEASSLYPELKVNIEKNYSNKSDLDKVEELVAQALSKVFNDELYSTPKYKRIRELIKDFIEEFKDFFRKLFNSKYREDYVIFPEELPKRFTLRDVAKALQTENSIVSLPFESFRNKIYFNISDEDFYTSGVLDPMDINYFGNTAVNLFSGLVDQLQGLDSRITASEAKTAYFGNLYDDVDFSKYDREELIQLITPQRLFSIVKDNFFNTFNREDLNNAEDEIFSKLDFCYDHFNELVNSASARLAFFEGIYVSDISKTDVLTTDNNDDLVYSDPLEKEENLKEAWQNNFRQTNIKDNLSPRIKRAFGRIPILDKNGEAILDEYGLPKFVQSDVAYNTILRLGNKALTIEEMEESFRANLSTNPWLQSVLEIIKEEPMRSQFFQNFRKDFTKYSVITRSLDSNGYYTFSNQNINTSNRVSEYSNKIRAEIFKGNTSIFKKVNVASGEAIVNNEEVATINNSVKEVVKEAIPNKGISKEDLREYIQNNIDSIQKILFSVGISIDDNTLLELGVGTTSKTDNIKPSDSTFISLMKKVEDLLSKLGVDKLNLYDKEANPLFASYRDLSEIISKYIDDLQDPSVTQSGKSYYSYTTPNYVNKLLNQLKSTNMSEEEYQKFLYKEFGRYEWFRSPRGEWMSNWLSILSKEKNSRKLLDHKVQLEYNRVSYMDMNDRDYTISLLQEYFSDKSGNTAWYYIPVMADKPSSEFIKFYRYTDKNTLDGYKKHIVNELNKIALQELRRIKSVRERQLLIKKGEIKEITNYDKRGSEFLFLPYLNDLVSDGRGKELFDEFLEGKYDNFIQLESLIKKEISFNMDKLSSEFYSKLEILGVFEKKDNNFLFVNNIARTNEELRRAIDNYYYNSVLASANIIQLTVTDIAFYKNSADFQKRFAQVHSPGLRFNITARDNKGERFSKDGLERTIYLKDNIVESDIIPQLKKIFEEKIEKAATKEEKAHLRKLADSIIKAFSEVNVADAQGYTSLRGYRKKMGMSGKWSDAMEEAYKRIQRGDWDLNDLQIVWQPLKPFVYTTTTQEGYTRDTKLIRVPVQNKNSEYLLLMAGALIESAGTNKLRVLDKFMSKYDIDTIQFESAVKSGKQGVLDINNLDSEEDIMSYLEKETGVNDTVNNDVVHTINFLDYAIQQEVPEHTTDASQSFGTQLRKLILADITPGISFYVGGNKMESADIIKHFQTLVAANVEQSYQDLANRLGLNSLDPKEKRRKLSEILVEEIKKNPRYGSELLRACSLDENGDFIVPLSDPIQATRVQQLINSIIKNSITKQKIKGGAAVQVSSYGMPNPPKAVFNDDGSLKYLECYLPAYSKEFINTTNKEGKVFTINDLPEDLRKIIGYRIPTEDKYSMAPLYIKGFLSKEAGSAIILPKEITVLSGSDFDIDKMYLMIPEFKVINHYDFKRAHEDYNREHPNYGKKYKDLENNLIKSLNKAFKDSFSILELSEEERKRVSEDSFSKWFSENKENYFIGKSVEKIKYDNTKSERANSTQARNNELIDIIYSILTNEDSLDKIFNPGSFESVKQAAKVITILSNTNKYSYNDLMEKSIGELDTILEEYLDSDLNLTDPYTQIYHRGQNSVAKQLIGIMATANSSHAVAQLDDIRLKDSSGFTFDNISTKSFGGKLDNIIALDGATRITKNLASLLAASVDAVKDPVLNLININTTTANVATTLIRLGYDITSVGLLLKQPIIVELVSDYSKENSTGFASMDSILDSKIEEIVKKLGGGITSSSRLSNLDSTDFTKENMAKHLDPNTLNSDKGLEYALDTLLLYKKIFKVSKDVKALTSITSYDTSGKSAGPTIGDTMTLKSQLERFEAKSLNPHSVFGASAYSILDRNPAISSFYTYSMKASEEIFKDYFPYFEIDFINVLNELSAYISGNLDGDLINKAFTQFITYKATRDVFSGNRKVRELYLKKFPEVASTIIDSITDNPFINSLAIKGGYDNGGIKSIVKKGEYFAGTRDLLSASWANLLKNPIYKDFARELFKYNFYKEGFSFSPESTASLTPVDIKRNMEEYMQFLQKDSSNSIYMPEDELSVITFMDQFRRNNSNITKLVPLVERDDINIMELDNGEIKISSKKYGNLDKIIVEKGTILNTYYPTIRIREGKEDRLYNNISEEYSSPIYRETTILNNEYSVNPEDVATSIYNSKEVSIDNSDMISIDDIGDDNTIIEEESKKEDKLSDILKNWDNMSKAIKESFEEIATKEIKDAEGEIVC